MVSRQQLSRAPPLQRRVKAESAKPRGLAMLLIQQNMRAAFAISDHVLVMK
jgi:ABC-type branched-subunit amino acid transport system ATPase component